MRQRFWFVAGEQAMSATSVNALDAWLAITIRAKTQPIADEFRRLQIECYDDSGSVIATRTWQGWQEALLRDTYGSKWREHTEHAASLM